MRARAEETEATEAATLDEESLPPQRESYPGKSRERRASPRVRVQLECEERLGASRYFRMTSDLSTFGLSTHRGFAHPPGTRLELRLFLPGEPRTPVCLDAEVVGWDGTDQALRLAFRAPPVEAVRRIHRFLVAERQRSAP